MLFSGVFMSKINELQAHVGFLLKRHDIINMSVVDLIRELQHHLFEAKIIQHTITHIINNKVSNIDSSVGDWKCQVRTSMIIDIIQNNPNLYTYLSKELNSINNIITNLDNLIISINRLTPSASQQLRQDLKHTSLYMFLQQHNVMYNTSNILTFLSLCCLTTLKNNYLPLFIKHHISTNKMKAIINHAKTTLCHLSINYEQDLASKYGTTNEQLLLKQIEFKGMQHMTALFSSFRTIYKKMKRQQQSFIMQNIWFCSCGKVQSIENQLYNCNNNIFTPTNTTDTHQVITVIESYQFPGSLLELQNILGIPHNEPGIPKEYYQPCKCPNPTPKKSIKSIDEAIMAFFAQHPQFTNHNPIDFEGLGLLNSDLKQEYDYLLTLPGFSRQNMSIFHINHMYPSTIADVIRETTQLNNAMNQHVNKRIMQPSCTISTQLN